MYLGLDVPKFYLMSSMVTYSLGTQSPYSTPWKADSVSMQVVRFVIILILFGTRYRYSYMKAASLNFGLSLSQMS